MVFGLETELDFSDEGRMEQAEDVSFVLDDGLTFAFEDEVFIDEFESVELA